jgi:hypothetical protein
MASLMSYLGALEPLHCVLARLLQNFFEFILTIAFGNATPPAANWSRACRQEILPR